MKLAKIGAVRYNNGQYEKTEENRSEHTSANSDANVGAERAVAVPPAPLRGLRFPTGGVL